MLGMCFNWRVLAGLAAITVGVLVFAPGATLAVLLLLVLAVCPLSMVAMMFAMNGMGSKGHDAVSAENLQARLTVLKDEERRLEAELAAVSAVELRQSGAQTPTPAARASS